jgi:hypothetical protein
LLYFILCVLNFLGQTSTPVPAASSTDKNHLVSPSASPVAELQAPPAKTNSETPGSLYVRKDAPARVTRFETPPVIDGVLNDAVWSSSTIFGDFVQISPGDNVKPSHPTEFMMGYDAKNLYMAFRIKQDRDKVRATVARRDNIFNDDYVLVHLDTFNDQRQAYLLFFSPLGIQADGTFTEGRGEDYSVDIVMDSKGVLTEDGFYD